MVYLVKYNEEWIRVYRHVYIDSQIMEDSVLSFYKLMESHMRSSRDTRYLITNKAHGTHLNVFTAIRDDSLFSTNICPILDNSFICTRYVKDWIVMSEYEYTKIFGE